MTIEEPIRLFLEKCSLSISPRGIPKVLITRNYIILKNLAQLYLSAGNRMLASASSEWSVGNRAGVRPNGVIARRTGGIPRKTKGSPIRRLLSRGTPLPLFFLLSFLIRLSRDKLIRAPVFSLLVSDMVRTSHPSGSRLWKCSLRNHLPAPVNHLPQKTVGATPCPRFTDSQILWLPLLGVQP